MTPPPASLDDPDQRAAAVARARAIVMEEVEGLRELAESIGPELVDAVHLIESRPGRLVISGVGKSGHIGAKLAATFASTGTPAFFLHAAEAIHGDLGMVMPGDTVMAISKSGTTRELYALLDYCADRDIPVIAITAEPGSKLGKSATIVLRLPDVAEVCPNNLAPTTSATLTLVMGHAMAVLAMDRRKFAHADFAQFHPGGRLGLRLSTIQRYMAEFGGEAPRVSVDASIQDVIAKLAGGRKGCLAVCAQDGAVLEGIITEGDLRRAISPELFSKTAGDIMTRNPVTITPEHMMAEAIQLMTARRVANIIVVEGTRPVDVLHMKDLLEQGYI